MFPNLIKEVVGFEGEQLRTRTRGIRVTRLNQRPPFVRDLRGSERKQVSRMEVVGLGEEIRQCRMQRVARYWSTYPPRICVEQIALFGGRCCRARGRCGGKGP